jgi:hypothetical protein
MSESLSAVGSAFAFHVDKRLKVEDLRNERIDVMSAPCSPG